MVSKRKGTTRRTRKRTQKKSRKMSKSLVGGKKNTHSSKKVGKKISRKRRGGFDPVAAAKRASETAVAAKNVADKTGLTDASMNVLKATKPDEYAKLMEAKEQAQQTIAVGKALTGRP